MRWGWGEVGPCGYPAAGVVDRAGGEHYRAVGDGEVAGGRLEVGEEGVGEFELDGGFSAGDLMMVSVLRRLAGSGLLEEVPRVLDYVARGEGRAAFKRAFARQLAVFAGGSRPGG